MKTYPWGTDRRINAASNHLKLAFGKRIQKVTVDAGFTCPNRDGTKGYGGCKFCNNDAFNPSYCTPDKPLSQQIEEGIEFHEKRYKRAVNYVAYFQAFSNTYASLDTLKNLYEQALQNEKIIGLIIGTRPDCVDEEKLEYLASLAEKYYLVIEYGIETIYDRTLRLINRGHSFKDSVNALHLTQKFGLRTGAHFIFGLPGESREEMMQSVREISRLPLHSIKFHQLQIVKNTVFEKEYLEDKSRFTLFSFDEYVEFIAAFISRLNPGFVIERLAAETQPRNCVSERWGLRYDQVLNRIEKKMEEHDYWQGKFYET